MIVAGAVTGKLGGSEGVTRQNPSNTTPCLLRRGQDEALVAAMCSTNPSKLCRLKSSGGYRRCCRRAATAGKSASLESSVSRPLLAKVGPLGGPSDCPPIASAIDADWPIIESIDLEFGGRAAKIPSTAAAAATRGSG